MALAIRKPHHLVFERRAVARTDAVNLPVEERRLARCARARARGPARSCGAGDRRSAADRSRPSGTRTAPADRRRAALEHARSRCCADAGAAACRSSAGPTGSRSDFSDSARSRDGGSPARPAGRCSRPTWTRPLRNVPVVTTSASAATGVAVLERQPGDAAVARRESCRPCRRSSGSRGSRSSAARDPGAVDALVGLRPRRPDRGPAAAVEQLELDRRSRRSRCPIKPPSASISRTRWPFAVPPIAGLQGMCATVPSTACRSPRRGPCAPPPTPLRRRRGPAPITMTSKSPADSFACDNYFPNTELVEDRVQHVVRRPRAR